MGLVRLTNEQGQVRPCGRDCGLRVPELQALLWPQRYTDLWASMKTTPSSGLFLVAVGYVLGM